MHYAYYGFSRRHRRSLRIGIALHAFIIACMTATLVAFMQVHGSKPLALWLGIGAFACLVGLIALDMHEKLKQLKTLREP